MKTRTKYISEVDGKEFDHPNEAMKHELSILKARERIEDEALLRQIYPHHHPEDDKYEIHCVRCGCLLERYEANWDGHRNERGEIEYSIEGGIHKVFSSKYCHPCYEDVWSLTLKHILLMPKTLKDKICPKK